MDNSFSGVKVCIWDFDGTFFRPIKALTDAILEADYQVVMAHRKWNREKTAEEFHKIFQVVTPSSTETAARLARIPLAQAAVECEWYKDRNAYLARDERLIALFGSLGKFTHFILANGIHEKIIPALAILGVPQETFVEIVTSEVVGVNKPKPDGFLYIMKKTGLPASAHMMIGDREAVDLVPAKALGMRTCFVSWGGDTPKTDCVDKVIPDVYTVAHLLL